MKSIPLVSVCMITYNHGPYIAQAIEGVLMQKTNFPFELIVGEDCSTDNTRAIVKEYAEKYPNMIVAQLPEKNRGMSENFISVLSSAKGKYIALCDGDDYWIDCDKLQKQVDFLETHEDVGLVYTRTKIYDQKTAAFQSNLLGAFRSGFVELIEKDSQIPALTTCFRKQFINEFLKMFTVELKKWMILDYPLWLFISSKYKIVFLEDVTAVYRVLQNSASHFQANDINRYKLIKCDFEIRTTFAKKFGFNISPSIYYDYLKRINNFYFEGLINKKILWSDYRKEWRLHNWYVYLKLSRKIFKYLILERINKL